MKYIPTPLIIDHDESGEHITLHSQKGELIATLDNGRGINESFGIAKELVGAINSHDELLASAEKLVGQLDRSASTPYMNLDVASLRDAIAKVKSK